MIKFLQRVGKDFRQAFKEGYNMPAAERQYSFLEGVLGSVIVGLPIVAAVSLVKAHFQKQACPELPEQKTSSNMQDTQTPTIPAPTKSWAAAEQAKAEAATEAQITR